MYNFAYDVKKIQCGHCSCQSSIVHFIYYWKRFFWSLIRGLKFNTLPNGITFELSTVSVKYIQYVSSLSLVNALLYREEHLTSIVLLVMFLLSVVPNKVCDLL